MARARHQYTYDEYLAYERESALEHEYDGGEISPVTGWNDRRLAQGGTWEYSVATDGGVTLATGAVIDLAWLDADLPD
jgi:hypothetical protein